MICTECGSVHITITGRRVYEMVSARIFALVALVSVPLFEGQPAIVKAECDDCGIWWDAYTYPE